MLVEYLPLPQDVESNAESEDELRSQLDRLSFIALVALTIYCIIPPSVCTSRTPSSAQAFTLKNTAKFTLTA